MSQAGSGIKQLPVSNHKVSDSALGYALTSKKSLHRPMRSHSLGYHYFKSYQRWHERFYARAQAKSFPLLTKPTSSHPEEGEVLSLNI